MSGDLRELIREVLSEELAAFRARKSSPAPAQRRIETVTMASDADLAAFARRVLALGQDSKTRAEIESGRYAFRLGREAGPNSGGAMLSAASSQTSASFERGLITESDIRKLGSGVKCIRAGKSVRFTPLARDEMRKSGIKLERTMS